MDKNTLKQWFSHGRRPSGTQFASLIDSFFHVDDTIPLAKINGLQNYVADAVGEVTEPAADPVCGHKKIEYGMQAVNSVEDQIVLGTGYACTHVSITVADRIKCSLDMENLGREEMHICNNTNKIIDIADVIHDGGITTGSLVEIVPSACELKPGEAVMVVFMRCASEDAPYDEKEQKIAVHLYK